MTQLAQPSRRRARHELRDTRPRSEPRGQDDDGGLVRGRHATSLGQGFGWTVGWTVLGTLVPGSGLLAAGRRLVGWLVLGVVLLVLAVLGGLILVGDPMQLALQSVVDTRRLLYLAIAAAVVGLVWALLVLLTHVALRRTAVLTRPQSVLAGGLAVAMIVAVAVPAYKLSSYSLIQRDLITSVFSAAEAPASDALRPAPQKQDPWAGIPRVNVLLVGSDAATGREGTRADTLILASIDTRTGDTVLFSLPRNLENVPFPIGSPEAEAWPNGFNCGGACLLNAVWAWGEANGERYYPKDKHPGLTATMSGVEGTLGLKIDYYAMLNLRGFQDFVDAIGGITIDVPRRLPIGGGTSLSGYSLPIYGYIKAGRNQHLSGFKALWFARSRSGSDDYDRMRRQRCVIGAVVQQADPVALAQSFPRLARSAKRNIGTDIRRSDLQAWVELSIRVKDGSVRSLPFTNSVITTSNPDYDLIHRLVQRALRPMGSATNPEASAGTDPRTTSGTGSSTPPSNTSSRSTNPRVAQDVTRVC